MTFPRFGGSRSRANIEVHHIRTYQQLGGNYFDEHDRMAIEKRLVRRLEK